MDCLKCNQSKEILDSQTKTLDTSREKELFRELAVTQIGAWIQQPRFWILHQTVYGIWGSPSEVFIFHDLDDHEKFGQELKLKKMSSMQNQHYKLSVEPDWVIQIIFGKKLTSGTLDKSPDQGWKFSFIVKLNSKMV